MESDFSAIHQVRDVHALTGRRFFTWAVRLPAYPGVLQVRVQAKVDDSAKVTQEHPEAPPLPLEVARMQSGFAGDGHQFPPVFEKLRG